MFESESELSGRYLLAESGIHTGVSNPGRGGDGRSCTRQAFWRRPKIEKSPRSTAIVSCISVESTHTWVPPFPDQEGGLRSGTAMSGSIRQNRGRLPSTL